MSQYHKVHLGEGHIVRDVPNPPFRKKIRLGTIELKNDLLHGIEKNEHMEYLKYVNTRIHYFVDKSILELSDKEITDYVHQNLYTIKNEIVI